MKIKFLVVVLLLSFTSYSQKERGSITLLDGTVIHGLVGLGEGVLSNSPTSFTFRENESAKKIKYDEKAAKSAIIINDKNEEVKFEFVFFDFQKKAILLKVGIDGYLKLYSQSYSYYAAGPNGFRSSSTYYLKKGNDSLGQYYIAYGYIPKVSFNKVVKNYFADCPALQQKVEKGEFKKDDFEVIVNFYNDNCAPKP